MLGAANLRQHRRLWRALGRPEMIKSSLQESIDNAENEEAVLRDIFVTRSALEWEEFLLAHRVPAGRVRDLEEALHDPQLAHRAVLQEVSVPGVGMARLPATAFTMSEGTPTIDRAPPHLDEHRDEISQAIQSRRRALRS